MQEKPAPKVMTDLPMAENNQTTKTIEKKEILKDSYSLTVDAPKGARVRILNIKPKYHDAIILKPENYLIEVTKDGYEKYKKWIKLDSDRLLHVKILKKKNSYNTKYFKYVTKIEWKNHHELFSLKYDKKSKLIWAMQSAYVDYVEQQRQKKILKSAVFAKGEPWPKIYETKIDTLIYSGYFRYRGRNFLFKNKNSVTLYKAGKKDQKGKKVAHLSKLETNSMINYWRLPKEKELLQSNPFLKYQKYFQLNYSRYKDIQLNLPILCTKLKKGTYYSNCSVAYAYNKRTGLYDGKRIKQHYFALRHAKNFALVTPVRAVSTQYDKIIFNTKIGVEEKLVRLTTLLIKEDFEYKSHKIEKIANKMASKAMHMIFGDPKLAGDRLYSITNNFSRRVKNSKMKKNLSLVLFNVSEGILHLKKIE
jgi:hypothetical protein